MSRKVLPGYDWPDKDFDEVRQEMAPSLGSIEKELDGFHLKHGPVLDAEARKMLKDCISLASLNKFGGDGAPYGNHEEALKASGEIFEKLEKLEEYLLDQVEK